jgi:serine/threonine-protein kinase RsbW
MVDSSETNVASLQLTAQLEDLERIRQFLEAFGVRANLDSSKTYDIDLAVTELVTNSLEHGYPDHTGWIGLDTWITEQLIVVRLRDRAPTFDPTQVPAPDRSLPLEKRGLGGMGIYLIRQIINRMEYRCLPGGGNEITLFFSTNS